MAAPLVSGDQVSFYYYASITPSVPSMTLKSMAPTSISRDSGSVYVITYKLSEMMSDPDRISAVQRTFCTPSSLLGSYQQVNNLTFNVVRGAYCTALEDYRPGIYCPLRAGSSSDPNRDYIRDFTGDNLSSKCTRLSSTNPVHNDYIINCPGIAEMLDVSSTDTAAPYIRQQFAKTCRENTDLLECQCINRALKTAYIDTVRVLGSGATQSGNAMCWYTPCMFEPGIVVDYSLQNAYSTVKCPDICQNIVAILKTGGNVNLNNVSLSTSCFNAPPATTTLPSSPTDSPKPASEIIIIKKENVITDQPIDQQQSISPWWWLLLLLIPIAAVIIYLLHKRK